MDREKATAAKDLPHCYVDRDGACRECGAQLPDQRHLAWEKAALTESQSSWFKDRELGT